MSYTNDAQPLQSTFTSTHTAQPTHSASAESRHKSGSSRRWLLGSAVALTMSAIVGTAYAAYERIGTPKVTFDATGTVNVHGEGNSLWLNDKGTELEVWVGLSSLTTGSMFALRDRHMHEKYLETAKYPNAVLTVASKDLNLPKGDGETGGKAPGKLKLHGQERDVSFNYRVIRKANVASVTGTLAVNMNDYGIASPAFAGARIKPEVNIAVAFNAKER